MSQEEEKKPKIPEESKKKRKPRGKNKGIAADTGFGEEGSYWGKTGTRRSRRRRSEKPPETPPKKPIVIDITDSPPPIHKPERHVPKPPSILGSSVPLSIKKQKRADLDKMLTALREAGQFWTPGQGEGKSLSVKAENLLDQYQKLNDNIKRVERDQQNETQRVDELETRLAAVKKKHEEVGKETELAEEQEIMKEMAHMDTYSRELEKQLRLRKKDQDDQITEWQNQLEDIVSQQRMIKTKKSKDGSPAETQKSHAESEALRLRRQELELNIVKKREQQMPGGPY